MSDPLLEQLERVVAREHVLVDEQETAAHLTDWTGRWHGDAVAVVRPASTAQVAGVLEVCAAAGRAVVPQGGNTGLVGGATPHDGAVLLLTSRLDRLGEVDPDGRVLVGAGVPLARVQAAARDAGWAVGVDIASRDSATIGGMVATDAGGRRVVANGSMRAQVLGLEAVLADGSVVRPWMEGLAKDVAGHDLRHLLIGSEGTLAVVTEVLLQLRRPDPTATTVLLGCATEHLPELVATVRRSVAASGARLTACEFMTRDGAALVADLLDLRSPLETPVALLVDLAGHVDDDLLAELDAAGSGPTVVGSDAADRARLWDLRERHTEAIAMLGTPVKIDVAVPVAALPRLLAMVRSTVATVAPHAACVLFGHAAEGNVHVNVVRAHEQQAPLLEDAVYDVVEGLGGTVSAEHGIGRAKVDHLVRTRDPGSIAAMRAVKRALDPGGLLNPGVVLATNEES